MTQQTSVKKINNYNNLNVVIKKKTIQNKTKMVDFA